MVYIVSLLFIRKHKCLWRIQYQIYLIKYQEILYKALYKYLAFEGHKVKSCKWLIHPIIIFVLDSRRSWDQHHASFRDFSLNFIQMHSLAWRSRVCLITLSDPVIQRKDNNLPNSVLICRKLQLYTFWANKMSTTVSYNKHEKKYMTWKT